MAKATDPAHSRNCANCVHHFITYDTHFPYGCRAMNFKSKRPPYLEVEESSGLPCQMWQLNPRKTVRRASS